MTAAATFCATLVDEWSRAGINAAYVSPGSRSTPLALALVAADGLDVHVFHDERSSGFAALGHSRLTGTPAVVLSTSGTAAAHFHGAVVEADLAGVPLIVCTADRPPEAWDVGAPQTIDQTHLYGSAVRWYAEPGVPDAAFASSWRSFASRAAAEARGASGAAGPVHLNLPFREPLVGVPAELPPGRAGGRPWHAADESDPRMPPEQADALLATIGSRPGVIVAGSGTRQPDAVVELAASLGWPILADHLSGARQPGRAVNHFDALLRTRFADERGVEVVLRFGAPPASRVLREWLAASEADTFVADCPAIWSNPDHRPGAQLGASNVAGALLLAPNRPSPRSDADAWLDADRRAADAIRGTLEAAQWPNEPGAAIAAAEAVPPGGVLFVASSMPVRDLEWFGPPRSDIRAVANRGANGIDGTVASAIGAATTGRPTICLLGDVALLHDSSSLSGLADREVDLTIVVVDNDGGGIFSFLPQAELLEPQEFEVLFGTPHGTDVLALARAHGLPAEPLARTVPPPSGVRVLVASTDRRANAALHDELHRAVANAIRTG